MYKQWLLLIILQAMLLVACQNEITDQQGQTKRIPDEQFLKLQFRYGFGNELNTYEMQFTKDLVLDGYVTIKFWLTTSEQESIANKLNEIDFKNLPDTLAVFSNRDSTIVQVVPSPGRQFIKAKLNGFEKEVGYYIPLPDDDSATEKILELTDFIINIIQQKPEYQALPAPRGGRI